jgi:plastocyanin
MTLTRRALAGAVGLLLPGLARAAEFEIDIDNFVFNPQEITVPAGTRVKWTNRDDIPHLVVASVSPPLFRSKAMDTDESYAFTFDKPGRYAYFCALHPHMQGTVIVT